LRQVLRDIAVAREHGAEADQTRPLACERLLEIVGEWLGRCLGRC
jgi:hypothetical protein